MRTVLRRWWWAAAVPAVVVVMMTLPRRAARPDDAVVARDVFGYNAAFDAELRKVGQISPDEFGRMFAPKAEYLDRPTFDPAGSKYWKEMKHNFRVNPEEEAAFKKNGFVVSERLGARSFAEIYYRVYSSDLPVFITADSVLHAWHRSYDAMLEELEETYLSKSLDEILAGMTLQIDPTKRPYSGVLAEGRKDADYFIAVARSLLAGEAVSTRLGQEVRLARTLAAVKAEGMQEFDLFGRRREVDFSQFKPRGHYEKSELLRRYFKAVMWLGRIDLRIAGGGVGGYTESSPRELGAAVVLLDLLTKARKVEQWEQFDRLIQTFIGRTDSMTFAQLRDVLDKGGIRSPADVKGVATLEAVQEQILAGKIGLQDLRSDCVVSPFGPEKAELPYSFTFLGQKFVVDSWVTAKVVFDDVLWDDKKVQRRVPSALDVAFAALGNDQTVPALVGRMKGGGRKFRDGLNYQHNLAAVRNVIDGQDPAVWDESIYMNWLAVLRELSKPTTNAKYPEAVRTQAWAMKSLNTQLASWTQLRHDTILYVKQSYGAREMCEYPAGYVEPVPHFWARFEKMATRAAALIEKTPFPDRRVEKLTKIGDEVVRKQTIELKDVRKRQAAHFAAFAKQMRFLKTVSEKQMARKPLGAAEAKALKDVVQIHPQSGWTRYDGWYPKLFYKGPHDSGKWDPLVADVHTDVPDPVAGDPGCVLTQGVGDIDLLLIAVDNGKDRTAYAGPLLSHYEFEMPGMSRKSDAEWKKDLKAGKSPPRPPWTKDYLVTKKNPPERSPSRRPDENLDDDDD